MVRIGIIGLGHWGPNYIRCFVGLDSVRVVAACDQNPEALSKIQKIYPFLKTTTDSRTVLEDSALDAIVIATPASAHFPLALRALESGKHVLVEKPLTVEIAEGRKLLNLSRRLKKIAMVAYTFLYNPRVRKIKQLVDEGELGEIYYLHATRTNLGPVRRDVNALWDLAPHDLSIFYHLFGEWPKEVSASSGSYLQGGLADVAFASLHYKENVMGHIHVSWLDPRKVRQLTVVGSKKMALFDDLDSVSPVKLFDKGIMKTRFEKPYSSFEEFKLLTRDAGVISPKVSEEEPLKIQCQHFVDCIRGNKTPLTSAQFGYEMLFVLKALEESLYNQGKPVKIAVH